MQLSSVNPETAKVLRHNPYQELERAYYERNYPRALQLQAAYFRDKIDKIFVAAQSLSLPIGFEPFEAYMTGFNFYYSPFDNTTHETLWGRWEATDDGTVIVRYADNCPKVRQRFSIAHELMHVYGHYDPEFKMQIDKIPDYATRKRLIERVADKSASYYLVPEPILRETWKETSNAAYQAHLYGVSQKTMEICLKDYGLTK